MGGTAYSFTWLTLPLPSKQTLTQLLQNAPIKPGLSEFILEHIKDLSTVMPTIEKICTLMFDEVEIQPRIESISQTIYGTVNNGSSQTNEIANHALVFML